MNLIRNPWIPTISINGEQRLLSLQELFATAGEIRDLAAPPHERIALLRLLICITQAALDGPADADEWEDCREKIPPAASVYLEKWQASFELFGDGPRFLQLPGLKVAKESGIPATKLDLSLASGNNATLFDNAAGDPRVVAPHRLALTLLTFQCFAPGGRIGVALWNGKDTPGKGSSSHAPCTPSSMLHTFLLGSSLLETLHLNLLNKEEAADLGEEWWGRPVWECPVNSAEDSQAVANATNTYLGRLAPLSRAIRLDPNGQEILLANGLDYPLPTHFREPAATLSMREDGPALLGVSLGRSIWRQLSAITVKRHSISDPISGPFALRNLQEDEGCVLWIGALATDKAKIEDVVEAAYEVPAGMFHDAGRKLFEEGVDLASRWQNALSGSIKTFAATLKLEPAPYERARHYYWTAVEQHVPKLLELAANPAEAGDLKTSTWGRSVRQAAWEAFDFACPHQTPRQIEAHAIGRQQLYLRKPKDPKASSKKKVKTQQPV